jgi:hypothetical protein
MAWLMQHHQMDVLMNMDNNKIARLSRLNNMGKIA